MGKGFLMPLPGPAMTAEQAENAKALWAGIGALRAHQGMDLLRHSLADDAAKTQSLMLNVKTEAEARACKQMDSAARLIERILAWLGQLDNEARAEDRPEAPDLSGGVPDKKEDAHEWATRAAAIRDLTERPAWRDFCLLLMGVAFGYADATGIVAPSEVPACNAARGGIEEVADRLNEWEARGTDAARWLDERAREEGTEESQDG